MWSGVSQGGVCWEWMCCLWDDVWDDGMYLLLMMERDIGVYVLLGRGLGVGCVVSVSIIVMMRMEY